MVPTWRFSQRHSCFKKIPREHVLAKGRRWGQSAGDLDPQAASRAPREAHTPPCDLPFCQGKAKGWGSKGWL